jgi:hypothetical protein
MIHRGLDASGDWIFGKGKNSFCKDLDAVMLNIRTRLLSFRNDCFFDMEAGIDWWNMGKNRRDITAAIKETIATSYGVVKLVSFDIEFSRDRTLTTTYHIDTIYGKDYANTEILTYA